MPRMKSGLLTNGGTGFTLEFAEAHVHFMLLNLLGGFVGRTIVMGLAPLVLFVETLHVSGCLVGVVKACYIKGLKQLPIFRLNRLH